MMSYLTNYGQKNSINNIQDLGLSADSQQSIGRQPILLVIFFINNIYLDCQLISLEFQKVHK
jgi:hypothetical protein